MWFGLFGLSFFRGEFICLGLLCWGSGFYNFTFCLDVRPLN